MALIRWFRVAALHPTGANKSSKPAQRRELKMLGKPWCGELTFTMMSINIFCPFLSAPTSTYLTPQMIRVRDLIGGSNFVFLYFEAGRTKT
jgi:hypothetical protein